MTALRVIHPGPFTTVQDLGRPGLAHLGVPLSGAADRASLRLANRLVGNPEGRAALGCLLGGLVVEAAGELTVSVTGAVAELWVDGSPRGRNCALPLRAGEQLRLGRPVLGARCYVAVRGGVDVPPVLGSRSYEQLGRLGPPPLAPGALLPAGPAPPGMPCWEAVAVPSPAAEPVLRILPGPRAGWLAAGLSALTGPSWSVLPASDRTGLRLAGPAVSRRPGELASEGALPGAVQLPADGRPILLGPDAGVTGGYPAVAVVVDADLDRMGQLAPGATVRLRLVR